jgi:hypothetical protein
MKRPPLPAIIQAVEQVCMVPFSEWAHGSHNPAPRFRAVYGWCARTVGYSYPEIQSPIGKDHSSAWSYVKRSFELVRTDRSFRLACARSLRAACAAYREAERSKPTWSPPENGCGLEDRSDSGAVYPVEGRKVPTVDDVARVLAGVTGHSTDHWAITGQSWTKVNIRWVWFVLCRQWCGMGCSGLAEASGYDRTTFLRANVRRFKRHQWDWYDLANVALLSEYRMGCGVIHPRRR